MKLSIIIVNWDTRDLLAECLESISVSGFRSSVYVVDNASTDGSAAMVRERFPWVRLIENRENVGFASANNQALLVSEGEYVMLLNPDTVVKPGALEALVDFMAEHPEAGAAGARLLNPDGTLQPSCHPFPTLSRELWRLFHLARPYPYALYRMENWNRETPREVHAVQGAAMLLRRETLDQVGLLDEDYFMYSEEVDLCYRIKEAGWEIYWVPQAEVVHYGGQSTRQVAEEMFLQLYRGKLRYFRKHHGRMAASLYKLILLAASLARLVVSPLACLERPEQREGHLKLAGNYWRLVGALHQM